MNLESVRNYQELAVWDQIKVVAARYPLLSGNPDLVSDVACVALNSLKPRYIKHNVDMHFFGTFLGAYPERSCRSRRGRGSLRVRVAPDGSG